METLILVLQVLLPFLCVALVGLILLQGGAGDLSSAFGGGGMLDSTLGVGASRKMAKVTGWLTAIFFALVLVLAIPHKGSFGTAKASPSSTSGQGPLSASGQTPVSASATAPRILELPVSASAPGSVPASATTATSIAPAPAVAATAAGTASGSEPQ